MWGRLSVAASRKPTGLPAALTWMPVQLLLLFVVTAAHRRVTSAALEVAMRQCRGSLAAIRARMRQPAA
jgi:hypothetical protein